ncbi:MAG: phage holin family protein [Pirellulaceae bacterium]
MSESNGSRSAPPARAAHDLGQLLNGLFDLGELQVQLFKVDAERSVRFFVLCVALFGIAMGFAIATAVIVLLTLSALLSEWTALSEGAALLISTLVGLLLTTGTGYAGWRIGKTVTTSFRRSKNEMGANLASLKTAVRQSAREYRTRERV